MARRPLESVPIMRETELPLVDRDIDFDKRFTGLETKIPVLMLPVRLETRFHTVVARGVHEERLKIRIFPDPIFVDSHERALTKSEANAGREFWKALHATEDPAVRLQSWRAMCTKVAPRRAGWVARRTRRRLRGGLRGSDATSPARAPLLPESWIAVGYADGKIVFETPSRPTDSSIAFNLGPESFDPATATLRADTESEWLFDFERAKLAGMAIDAPLGEKGKNGLDELYVLGVPDQTSGSRAIARRFSNLLEAHLYTEGAGFAPQGIATNNTAEIRSGWFPQQSNVDALFLLEFPEFAPPVARSDSAPTGLVTRNAGAPGTNAGKLKHALGITGRTPLTRMEFSDVSEDALQGWMNTVLWPVTWGRFLKEFLRGEETDFFDASDIDWIRELFVEHVRGGANLPALRVGESPFGIVLASLHAESNPKDERIAKLVELIELLRKEWQKHAKDVPRLTDAAQYGDPGVTLIEASA